MILLFDLSINLYVKFFHYHVRKYILWNEGLIFVYFWQKFCSQKFWFVNVGFISYIFQKVFCYLKVL